MTCHDFMYGRMATNFGYDLAKIIGLLFASEKNLLLLSFEPCQAGEKTPTLGGVRGWGDSISKCRAKGLPPITILLFLPISKHMIFSLFPPKSVSIWPILMANLFLHILLHLLTYDEVQTVRWLT